MQVWLPGSRTRTDMPTEGCLTRTGSETGAQAPIPSETASVMTSSAGVSAAIICAWVKVRAR